MAKVMESAINSHEPICKKITRDSFPGHIVFLVIVAIFGGIAIASLHVALRQERALMLGRVNKGDAALEVEIKKNRNEMIANRGIGLRIEDDQDQIRTDINEILTLLRDQSGITKAGK